jgi:hypothetical protein
MTHSVQVTSANDVLRTAVPPMLQAAGNQLADKSPAGHSKNVFLIAHPLEYPAVEVLQSPLIAPLLEPLSDVPDVDTVWMLWHPSHLVVWSTARQDWISLFFDVGDGAPPPEYGHSLDLLQEVEQEFLAQVGWTGSPYVYGFHSAADDEGDEAGD